MLLMPWSHPALCLLSPSQRSVVAVNKLAEYVVTCHILMDVLDVLIVGHVFEYIVKHITHNFIQLQPKLKAKLVKLLVS